MTKQTWSCTLTDFKSMPKLSYLIQFKFPSWNNNVQPPMMPNPGTCAQLSFWCLLCGKCLLIHWPMECPYFPSGPTHPSSQQTNNVHRFSPRRSKWGGREYVQCSPNSSWWCLWWCGLAPAIFQPLMHSCMMCVKSFVTLVEAMGACMHTFKWERNCIPAKHAYKGILPLCMCYQLYPTKTKQACSLYAYTQVCWDRPDLFPLCGDNSCFSDLGLGECMFETNSTTQKCRFVL